MTERNTLASENSGYGFIKKCVDMNMLPCSELGAVHGAVPRSQNLETSNFDL